MFGTGEDIASLDPQRRSRAQKDTDEPSRWNAAGLVIPREYSTPSERMMSGLQSIVFLPFFVAVTAYLTSSSRQVICTPQ